MHPPSPTLGYLRRAFRRGDLDLVRTRGDALAAALAADPRWEPELAELALLVGAAHAAADELPLAEAYLEQGLARSDEHHGSASSPAPGGPSGPPAGPAVAGPMRQGWVDTPLPAGPPIAPAGRPEGPDHHATEARDRATALPAVEGVWPGAVPPPPPPPWWRDDPWSELQRGPTAGSSPFRAAQGPAPAPVAGHWGPDPAPVWPPPPPAVPRRRDLFVEWCELLLCELHLRTGRTVEAGDRLVGLTEPHHDVVTRFAATRGQATIAALAGHHERAHHLLNTAAGLAARVPSRFRAALVERDRALVLARQGRLGEALALAERTLGPLVRPLAGRYQRWSRTEGASLAISLSRQAALAAGGDAAARHLLAVAGEATAPLGHRYLEGHLAVATAVVRGSELDPAAIEEELVRVATTFERCGDRAAAALVLVEHGRLAHHRGLARSARPLYERAGAELRACAHHDEARAVERLRAELDAGRPPSPAHWR